MARLPEQLDGLYGQHPELFPVGWGQGYVFCGLTPASRKQGLRCRRVRLTASEVVFTVAPAFVMPYMTASVAEVEKAVFLMRFHVPCWALAHVFGRDAMYWYRLEQGLGRFSVVGTTVKCSGLQSKHAGPAIEGVFDLQSTRPKTGIICN